KPEHLPDVALQVHVLRRAGLPVERAAVMHLNPECRYPDLSNLFAREDVSAPVEGVLLGLPDELAAQQRMLEGPLPQVPIGDHCPRPHDCPFLERCWPKLPDHHVSSLYRIERKKALQYEADGYATIYDLPSDLELSVIHQRQVRAVTAGRMVVEPALAEAPVQFASPLVRNHVYHPDFGGSFSIKRTLPALVPGLSYADLKIGDGETATLELMHLMFSEELSPVERVELREALLRYCERDTWAMVKMLAKLRTLVMDRRRASRRRSLPRRRSAKSRLLVTR